MREKNTEQLSNGEGRQGENKTEEFAFKCILELSPEQIAADWKRKQIK